MVKELYEYQLVSLYKVSTTPGNPGNLVEFY